MFYALLFYAYLAIISLKFSDSLNYDKIAKLHDEIIYPNSENKLVVIVTGASSGIGRAIALELASHTLKFKVWATMRDISKWNGADDEALRVATMDVTSDFSVKELVDKVMEEDKRIDIIVNNAGYGVSGCLETVDMNEAKALFDVNLWGVVRVLQFVLPHMRNAKQGYIINISSTSGIRGIPCFEFYTSSKFALEGLTDSMRYSLSSFNISVTNVNAGPVITGFTERFGNSEVGGKGTRDPSDSTGYLEGLSQMMIDSLNRRMASQEAQSAESVAEIVHHLAVLKYEGRGRITDVPFNIGTSQESQKVIEDVRVNPTGWGGIYSQLLANMPILEDEDTMDISTPSEEL